MVVVGVGRSLHAGVVTNQWCVFSVADGIWAWLLLFEAAHYRGGQWGGRSHRKLSAEDMSWSATYVSSACVYVCVYRASKYTTRVHRCELEDKRYSIQYTCTVVRIGWVFFLSFFKIRSGNRNAEIIYKKLDLKTGQTWRLTEADVFWCFVLLGLFFFSCNRWNATNVFSLHIRLWVQ